MHRPASVWRVEVNPFERQVPTMRKYGFSISRSNLAVHDARSDAFRVEGLGDIARGFDRLVGLRTGARWWKRSWRPASRPAEPAAHSGNYRDLGAMAIAFRSDVARVEALTRRLLARCSLRHRSSNALSVRRPVCNRQKEGWFVVDPPCQFSVLRSSAADLQKNDVLLASAERVCAVESRAHRSVRRFAVGGRNRECQRRPRFRAQPDGPHQS